jgi:hypothetical protein
LYLEEAIPAICNTWDAQELLRRGSADLLKSAPEAKVVQYFEVFSRKLGRPKRISPPTGGSFFNFGTAGFQVLGYYEVAAEFEHGEGVVRVNLCKQAGGWRISSFFVNSDSLMP